MCSEMSCTYKQGLLIYWSPVHHNCLSNCQKCTSEELLNVMCNNYLYISFWSIVLHISQKLSVIKKSLQQRKNLKIFYYIHIYSETSWGFFFFLKESSLMLFIPLYSHAFLDLISFIIPEAIHLNISWCFYLIFATQSF